MPWKDVPWVVGMVVLEASHSLPTVVFPCGLCQPVKGALPLGGIVIMVMAIITRHSSKIQSMIVQLEENIQKYVRGGSVTAGG